MLIQVHNAGSQADPGQGLCCKIGSMNRKGEVSFARARLHSRLPVLLAGNQPHRLSGGAGAIQGNTLHPDHPGRGQNRRLPGGPDRRGHASPTWRLPHPKRWQCTAASG